MADKTVLVTGARGQIGRYVAQQFARTPGWRSIGLSRSAPEFDVDFEHLSVDLLDPKDCLEKICAISGVTHLVHAAFQPRGSDAETIAANVAMLANFIDGAEAASLSIEHVTLMTGARAYGSHLGRFKTPSEETDLTHFPPNFYFDMQRWLEARHAQGRKWRWTNLRPCVVMSVGIGSPYNLLNIIAVYASIAKALGEPFRFPGNEAGYRRITQALDAELLAEVCVWAAEEERAHGEYFNVTNGDVYRTEHVWPDFAEWFGLPLGGIQKIDLKTAMADKEPLWAEIVETHGLRKFTLEQFVYWPQGDSMFSRDWDDFHSTNKLRQFGFEGFRDTRKMFLRLFTEMRDLKIIP